MKKCVKIVIVLVLAGISLIPLSGNPMQPSGNVNTGALFFNPATGGVNEALTPGNALIGTQGLTTPTNDSGGSVLGTSTTGSSTPTNPNYGSQISSIQGLIGNLNNMYNTLYGSFNQGVATQRQGIDSGYGQQEQQLTDQYGQAAPQLAGMEAARGLSDSTYAGTAQTNAGQTYQDQFGGIQTANSNDDLKLAQQAAGQLAQYHGQQDALNNQASVLGQIPNDESGEYELGNIYNQLNSQVPTLQGALATAQSPQALMGSLNTQAPSQVYDAGALQGQLQSLAKSSIPSFAQQQISSAAINSASQNPTDQNYWLNYAKNLGIG